MIYDRERALSGPESICFACADDDCYDCQDEDCECPCEPKPYAR